MDHASLVELILNVNGVAVIGSLGAYYHFEIKLPSTYGIAKEFDETVLGLRRALARDLSKRLSPIFEKPPVTISATPENYTEKPSNPVDTESYRDALNDFIENHIDAIKDYRVIKSHCACHRTWLNRIVCLVSLLFLTASSIFILVYLSEKVYKAALWDGVLLTLLLIPGILSFAIVICDRIRLYNSHRAMKLRSQYETL